MNLKKIKNKKKPSLSSIAPHRETDRQRQRQTDRQIETKKETETDRQTDTQRQRQILKENYNAHGYY